MALLETRRLGKAAISVPVVGFGGAPIGELFERVSDATALTTLEAAWEEGVRYFDTSPYYGRGLSEHRIGNLLYSRDPDEYVLSTKVGRVFHAPRDPRVFDTSPWVGGHKFDLRFDYSYDGVMRSYEDSLLRLGVPRVNLLVIHDLDYWFHGTQTRVDAYLAQLIAGGWQALEQLRSSGAIQGIGVGVNDLGLIPKFLDAIDPDFFLLAMRYTLMEQDVLDVELPRCQAANVGIVVGSVFSSGITATGPVAGAKYNYGEPTQAILDKVSRMATVCEAFQVPLAAAALQFPLGHPSVAAVLPGAIHQEHVRRNLDLLRHPIPSDLWSALKSERLIREDAPVPG